MKRRKACAVLCTFSILSSLFTGAVAMAAPEEGQTEAVTGQAETAEQTEADAGTEAAETEVAAEQTEAVTEAAETSEQSTEAEESEGQTEAGDAVKIDRDHPEGRIGVAYDQSNAWDELVMANDEIVDTGVNIRQTADPEGEVIGYLYAGCAAWVLNKGDEWTEIYSGGLTGFVKTEYLVFGQDAKTMAEKYGTDGITAMWEGVAVFADPDGDSEVVKVLRTGDDMFLVADEGNWLQVKLDEDNTAYVFSGDVTRSLVLDSAVPKSGVYEDVEPAAETEAETYEEETEDTSGEEEYVEPEYTEPEYTEPEYTEPEYTQPQTDAPQTDAPQTDAPQTNASQTDAPQTDAPQTDAPQTDAPQTDAPQTDAPQTDAPQTDAPQTDDGGLDDGGNDDGGIDIGDEGWYDVDTDTYYDANGNVISQGADSLYDGETYVDVAEDPSETYTEEIYVEETEAYVESTEAYAEETEAYVEETTAYVEETEAYVEETTAYVEETEAYVEETTASSSVDDATLLAALIYCEAGNQSYEGQVAVGAVVMNRVNSSSFPNSISEVIYQSGQFTPASSGSLESAIANGIPSSCYEAASAALSGENPVGDALYFNAGSGTGTQIGDHQFY